MQTFPASIGTTTPTRYATSHGIVRTLAKWAFAIFFGAALALAPLSRSVDLHVEYFNVLASVYQKLGGSSYVFVGDSITRNAGLWGLHLHLNPLTSQNLGRPGNPSSSVVRIALTALEKKPNVIFFMAGTNDVLLGIDNPAQTSKSIQGLALEAKRAGTKLIVSLAPPLSDPRYSARVRAINDQISVDLSSMDGVTVIDTWPALSTDGRLADDLTLDGTHLNDRGYALWISLIRTAVPNLPKF